MRALLIPLAVLLLASCASARRPLLGSKRCTWGPAYWCSHVGTMKECKSSEFCTQRWLRSPEPGNHSRPAECVQCKMLVRQLGKLAESNMTESAIRQSGRRICDLAQDAKLCRSVIDSYLPEVLQLLRAGMSASRVCSALTLCGSRNRDSALRSAGQLVRVPLRKSPQRSARTALCDDCVNVLNSVKQAIENNQTEAEIAAMLKANICSQLGPMKDTCDSLIDEYLPQVLGMIDQDVQPQQICSLLGFCSGSVASSPRMRRLMLLVTLKVHRPLAGVECGVCTSLVGEARALLEDGKTEKTIVDFVKNRICSMAPAESEQCARAVDEYGGLIMHLLASSLNPTSVCQAFGACQRSALRSLPRVGPQCILCEFVMHQLQQLLGDNRTEASIESALESVCSVMPQSISAECDGFVRQYAPVIVSLIAHNLNPELLCTTIGLCAQSNGVAVQPLASATACDVCQTVVMYAKALLSDNSTEEDVLKVVEKVCNFLPTSEQPQCRAFIQQYGAQAIQLLLQDINAAAVCQELSLCAASLKYGHDISPFRDDLLA